MKLKLLIVFMILSIPSLSLSMEQEKPIQSRDDKTSSHSFSDYIITVLDFLIPDSDTENNNSEGGIENDDSEDSDAEYSEYITNLSIFENSKKLDGPVISVEICVIDTATSSIILTKEIYKNEWRIPCTFINSSHGKRTQECATQLAENYGIHTPQWEYNYIREDTLNSLVKSHCYIRHRQITTAHTGTLKSSNPTIEARWFSKNALAGIAIDEVIHTKEHLASMINNLHFNPNLQKNNFQFTTEDDEETIDSYKLNGPINIIDLYVINAACSILLCKSKNESQWSVPHDYINTTQHKTIENCAKKLAENYGMKVNNLKKEECAEAKVLLKYGANIDCQYRYRISTDNFSESSERFDENIKTQWASQDAIGDLNINEHIHTKQELLSMIEKYQNIKKERQSRLKHQEHEKIQKDLVQKAIAQEEKNLIDSYILVDEFDRD